MFNWMKKKQKPNGKPQHKDNVKEAEQLLEVTRTLKIVTAEGIEMDFIEGECHEVCNSTGCKKTKSDNGCQQTRSNASCDASFSDDSR